MDKSVFFDAFENAGLLEVAVIDSGPSTGERLRVIYREPSQVVFDGMAQTTDYVIRYQIADMKLAKDTQLSIKEKKFSVLQKPQATGNGQTYAIANLGLIKP